MAEKAVSAGVSWDLFASDHSDDNLRSLTLLAAQLAESPAHRVRVFIDDLARLSGLSARIDTGLWLQPFSGYELARVRLAEACVPADNVVAFHGTSIAPRYLERMVYGSTIHRKLFTILPLGASTAGQGKPPPTPSNVKTIEVVQGDSPTAAGFIRDRRNLVDLRSRWKAQNALKEATLEVLGLSGHLVRGNMIVTCWGASIPDWLRFIRAFAQAAERSVLVLAGPGVSMADLVAQREYAVAETAERYPVHCLRLPTMTWGQLDEIVWSSDLLLTGQRDVAHRAIESGTPLMWLPDEKRATAYDDGLSDWYYADLEPGYKRCVLAAANAVSCAGSVKNAMSWFCPQMDDLAGMALRVAARVAEAPMLVDRLPTLTPQPSGSGADEQSYHADAYVATWPMSLPGPLEPS